MIELGQVSVDYDLLAADEVDSALDQLDWHGELCGDRRLFLSRHRV